RIAERAEPRRHEPLPNIRFRHPRRARTQRDQQVTRVVDRFAAHLVRRAQAVLVAVAPVARLDDADQRRAERIDPRLDTLDGDPIRLEDRPRWRSSESGRGTIDVNLAGLCRDRAALELDAVDP